MLDAGGCPVVGPRPAYEQTDRWNNGQPDLSWLLAQGGKAVKWIDPTLCINLPDYLPCSPIILFMKRNPKEQAKSQLKLAGIPSDAINKSIIRKLAKSIERDYRNAKVKLKKSSLVIPARFEDFISDPAGAADILERIVGGPFDRKAAASAVVRRGPECLPGLEMEAIVLPTIARGLAARDVQISRVAR